MTPEIYQVIVDFLRTCCNAPVINYTEDGPHDAGQFQIPQRKGPSPLVKFSSVFLEDNSPEEISEKLVAWKLCEVMNRSSHMTVFVTSDGIKVVERN